MTQARLHGVTKTGILDLSLALAIAQHRAAEDPHATEVLVGIESIDHARDLLRHDALFIEMNRERGEGHGRTRAQARLELVAGPTWMRRSREAHAAGHTPPSLSEQQLAPHVVLDSRCGYVRTKKGGNRGTLRIQTKTITAFAAENAWGDLVAHFHAQISAAAQGRIHQGSPFRARSAKARLASRRSHHARTARRLLQSGPGLFRALQRGLLHVLEKTHQRGRLLKPTSDVVVVHAHEIDDLEERAGWKEMRRRGLAHGVQDAVTQRLAYVLNLRTFASWASAEAAPLRAALVPRNRFVAP